MAKSKDNVLVGLIFVGMVVVVVGYYIGISIGMREGIQRTQMSMVFNKACSLVSNEEITNIALKADNVLSSGGVSCDEMKGGKCLLGENSLFKEEKYFTMADTKIKSPWCFVWVID